MVTLSPWEEIPGTHWIWGWVGFRASLDKEATGKILCLCQGSNPTCPVCSHTLYWLSYLSSNHYFRNKLVYRKNVVIVTSATGIKFLLFTCVHCWVWGIVLWRWGTCVATTYEVVCDCQKFQKYWVTGYCYEVLSYKASHVLRPFSDLLYVPIWVLITPDTSTSAIWLQQRHLVAKQRVGKKYPWT
jgi:hypothetical protein